MSPHSTVLIPDTPYTQTHTHTNTKQWDVANKTKAAIFTRRQAKTSRNKLNTTRSAESERKKRWYCARLIFEWIFRNTLAHCSHNFHTILTHSLTSHLIPFNCCFFLAFVCLCFLWAKRKNSLVVFLCSELFLFHLNLSINKFVVVVASSVWATFAACLYSKKLLWQANWMNESEHESKYTSSNLSHSIFPQIFHAKFVTLC